MDTNITKNYIFLDIDGVLNSTDSPPCHFHRVLAQGEPLSKVHLNFIEDNVKTLGKLIEEHSCNIVITSLWRFGAKKQWFIDLFKLYDIYLHSYDIDLLHTDEYEDGSGERGRIVSKYIHELGCVSYVCIDDTASHYNNFHTPDRVVITNGKCGITTEDALKCHQILHGV